MYQYYRSVFTDSIVSATSFILKKIVALPVEILSNLTTFARMILPYRNNTYSNLVNDIVAFGRGVSRSIPLVLGTGLAYLIPGGLYVAGAAFISTYLFRTSASINYLLGSVKLDLNSFDEISDYVFDSAKFENGQGLTHAELRLWLKEIKEKAGNPDITFYILPTSMPNALAISNLIAKCSGSVTLTSGLINQLIISNDNDKEACKRQLQAVVSHEIQHVLRHHTKIHQLSHLLKALTFVVASGLLTAATGNLHMFDSLMAASILIDTYLFPAMTRSFEFTADAFGVQMGLGEDMIEALKVLNNEKPDYPSQVKSGQTKGGLAYESGFHRLTDTLHYLTHDTASHPAMQLRYAAIRAEMDSYNTEQGKKKVISTETDIAEALEANIDIPMMSKPAA